MGSQRGWLRWLTIPAALAVILLVALSLRAETRSEFDARIEALIEDEERQSELRERAADASTIILNTPDGSVALSTDGSTVIGEGGDGTALVLTPDENGDIVGFRVLDDGTIEPVTIGEEITDDTYVIRSSSDGQIVSPGRGATSTT